MGARIEIKLDWVGVPIEFLVHGCRDRNQTPLDDFSQLQGGIVPPESKPVDF